MNDRQSFPDRLPRRRSSVFDDGPIKIYETAASPQIASGVSLPAVAAIVGLAAFAGLTAIHYLGDSPAAANNGRFAIETAAADEDDVTEPAEVATTSGVHTASVKVEEAEIAAAPAPDQSTTARLTVRQLKRDDPRWSARAGAAASPAAAAIKALAEDYRSDEPRNSPGEMMAFAPRPDSPADAVEAALEPDDAARGEEAAAAIPQVAEKPTAPPRASRTAQVRSAVNMRSRPRKGASVLTVIPARASVGVVDCDLWCHVVYEGREGYVFRDFVEGRARIEAKPVSAQARPPAEAASEPEPAAAQPVPLSDHITNGNRGR